LALCKGLAEKMGGRIWLESEPGQGSCFSFSAPFTIAENEIPSIPTSAVTAPASRRAKAALVVDDQEYNRIVLTDLLESLGFDVHNAGDGTAALALAGSQVFDAIFLDYNLPGLSGVEVTRGIRALSNKSATAVILATTAFSTPEKRNQCLAAGMNAFLGKPVTMERLRKALATAMPADAAPSPVPAPPPADGLANLRLLAKKKGAPFADELALYLSELDVELEHLLAAVQHEDATKTAHYAHLLYGRCAFIAERELEHVLRKIEADSAAGHWDDVRVLAGELPAQAGVLRVRLASSVPAVPPA
jgi:CheY-like chemotaxis protein